MVEVSNVYRCRCLLALHDQDIHTHKQWVNGTPAGHECNVLIILVLEYRRDAGLIDLTKLAVIISSKGLTLPPGHVTA